MTQKKYLQRFFRELRHLGLSHKVARELTSLYRKGSITLDALCDILERDGWQHEMSGKVYYDDLVRYGCKHYEGDVLTSDSVLIARKKGKEVVLPPKLPLMQERLFEVTYD